MSFVYAVQYLLLSNSPQSVVILSLNKYSRKTPSVPDLYGVGGKFTGGDFTPPGHLHQTVL